MDAGVTGSNETTKERMSRVGFAQKFGMELAGDEKRVVLQFDHFDQFAIRRRAAEDKACFLELSPIRIVEFVAVAVPFVNQEGTV